MGPWFGYFRCRHAALLAALQGANPIDGSRAVVDSASVRAVGAGKNGSPSHGPQEGRQQAPRHQRRAGYPVQNDPDRCPCPRCHPAVAAGRRYSSCNKENEAASVVDQTVCKGTGL